LRRGLRGDGGTDLTPARRHEFRNDPRSANESIGTGP